MEMDKNLVINKKNLTVASSLLALSLVSFNTLAEIELFDGKGDGMPLGPGRLFPEINVTPFYDDNLLRSNTNELDTFGTKVAPKISYELSGNKKEFFASYEMEGAVHEDNRASTDDYIDHIVSTGFRYAPTSRASVGITGEFKDTRDPRGTGAAEGGAGIIQGKPDEYRQYEVIGSGVYGAESSKGRAEMDVGFKDKKYNNNRATTFVRDREDTSVDGRFYYQIMPKTSLLFDARFKDIDYDNDYNGNGFLPPVASLDGTQYSGLVGLTWAATYKTTGKATVGYRQKDFDSSRKDDGGVAWEVEMIWQPRTYSIVNLSTSSEFKETNGTGNAIEEDAVSADWTHYWQDNLSTNVNFRYAQNDFSGDTTGRDDDLLNASVSLNYEMQRWLTVGASYNYDERDSNFNNFDYERNVVQAFFTIAM